MDFSVREIGDVQEFEDNIGETEKNEEVDDSDQVVTGQGDVELHNPNFVEEGEEDEEEEEDLEEKDAKRIMPLGHQQEEDDEDEEEDDDDDVAAPPAEGSYDPSEYDHLPVDGEIKELFTYIMKYTPQTIDLDHKFKPFVPEYIPAVGDIDAFIRCTRPDNKQEVGRIVHNLSMTNTSSPDKGIDCAGRTISNPV